MHVIVGWAEKQTQRERQVPRPTEGSSRAHHRRMEAYSRAHTLDGMTSGGLIWLPQRDVSSFDRRMSSTSLFAFLFNVGNRLLGRKRDKESDRYRSIQTLSLHADRRVKSRHYRRTGTYSRAHVADGMPSGGVVLVDTKNGTYINRRVS